MFICMFGITILGLFVACLKPFHITHNREEGFFSNSHKIRNISEFYTKSAYLFRARSKSKYLTTDFAFWMFSLSVPTTFINQFLLIPIAEWRSLEDTANDKIRKISPDTMILLHWFVNIFFLLLKTFLFFFLVQQAIRRWK